MSAPDTTRQDARAQFVLVDVGCIECGESTEVPAVFSDEGEARETFMALCAKIGKEPQLDYGWPLYLGYFTGGQRSLELHRVGAADANQKVPSD